MSKMQRDKGATFEREIANDLTADWGVKIQRNIGQARDGGDDITVPPYRIECKRRRKVAVYGFLEQVEKTLERKQIPVVVIRADHKEPIVVMRYADWKKLAREDLDSIKLLTELFE